MSCPHRACVKRKEGNTRCADITGAVYYKAFSLSPDMKPLFNAMPQKADRRATSTV